MGNVPIWTACSLKSGNSQRFEAFLAKLLEKQGLKSPDLPFGGQVCLKSFWTSVKAVARRLSTAFSDRNAGKADF